jgi:hypothetical protein
VALVPEVRLADDLDGGEAEETIRFALDGSRYTVDLSGKNARRLRDAVAAYVGAARRAGRRPLQQALDQPLAGPTRPVVPRPLIWESQAIRGWARQRGMKVRPRSVSRAVLDAYHKEHWLHCHGHGSNTTHDETLLSLSLVG